MVSDRTSQLMPFAHSDTEFSVLSGSKSQNLLAHSSTLTLRIAADVLPCHQVATIIRVPVYFDLLEQDSTISILSSFGDNSRPEDLKASMHLRAYSEGCSIFA